MTLWLGRVSVLIASFLPAGSCPARRLAARLLPRFLQRVPDEVEACANSLMDLYLDKHRTPLDAANVVASTRSDALRGLGDVLDAGLRTPDKAVPTIVRVVDLLLK